MSLVDDVKNIMVDMINKKITPLESCKKLYVLCKENNITNDNAGNFTAGNSGNVS